MGPQPGPKGRFSDTRQVECNTLFAPYGAQTQILPTHCIGGSLDNPALTNIKVYEAS